MKKYYPVDFDEKGNAVLGRAKNTPTSNGFIPTTWAPDGGDEGNGIKSITITPAITTDPALESLFPIYYENLTAEEKEDGVYIEVDVDAPPVTDYTFTLTPTDDMYAGIMGIGGAPIMGDEKGAPVSGTNQNTPVVQNAMFSVSEVPMGDVEPSDKHFNVYLTVKTGK